MKLKRKVADLDDVPEALHALYTQDGDGYVLTDDLEIEGYQSDDEVRGLVTTLKTLRGEIKSLKENFRGIDPEEYQALKEAQEKIDLERQKQAGDWEARERALTEKFGKEIAGREQSISTLQSALERQLIDNVAKDALIAARAKKIGGIQLLMPHIKQRVRVAKADSGDFRVEVLGDDGEPKISSQKGSTAPMSILELVEEMRESDEFMGCFEADGTSGSGSSGEAGHGGAVVRTREQLRDPATYDKAMKEAAERGVELQIKE